MTDFPSQAPTPELSEALVTRIPDPEQLVYEYVAQAAQQGLPSGVPALSFYADRARAQAEGRRIDVVRGWPAYPGVVPAIGIASGTEGEDQQHQVMQGGYAGEVLAYNDGGQVIGAADYYSEPLYVPVIVQLIHENRDERDRLHEELRRVLFPIRSTLPRTDPQVKRVTLDGTKDEVSEGPPVVQAPFTVYISIFTVHVYCEMLEPRNIVAGSLGEPIIIGEVGGPGGLQVGP